MDFNLINYIKKIKNQIKPDADFALRSRQNIERHVRLSASKKASIASLSLRYGFPFALAMIVIIVFMPSAVAWADSSKPGDAMYLVDRLLENIELFVAYQPQSKARVYSKILQERVGELDRLSQTESSQFQQKSIAQVEQVLDDLEDLSAQQSQDVGQIVDRAISDQQPILLQVREKISNPKVLRELQRLEKRLLIPIKQKKQYKEKPKVNIPLNVKGSTVGEKVENNIVAEPVIESIEAVKDENYPEPSKTPLPTFLKIIDESATRSVIRKINIFDPKL